ncbi:acetolactate synthase small subunit [Clostridium sp. SM-530-WT-3G]|uniref:acetolactate synthase small subunit n=1 Tax=Clostridium sp. SM-530-WT-3G TaxID=2725303 RepID=UPI00145E6DA3|nr:acetolactate synthase small subunit [Clostridium sp. SM-530-WT-3G]NME83538.1 acetolactate synthase small subunit [Clostridium sp. SM-530-WT-3G]
MEKHVLSALVRNSSGVLSRVSGLFSRRGYNIDSFTAGITDDPSFSRMTITLTTDDDGLEQVKKQFEKLEDVIRVISFKANECVYRELVLIKVRANAENRAAINEIVSIFRSKIIDLSPDTLTIELTGDEEKITALIKLMEEYGIEELVRTGVTALQRGGKTINNSVDNFNL